MAKLTKANMNNILVVDIETVDPELTKLGAGVYHAPIGSYVLGVGVYDTETKESRYYNFGHKDHAIEKEECRALLESDRDKLLANASYDIDWLENREGIKVNGFIHDVQIAEPLLNPFRKSFALNVLASYYNVTLKATNEITEYASRIAGDKGIKSPQSYLSKMPFEVVAKYCLGDLQSTYEVFCEQLPLLIKNELLDLYFLECNLIRVQMLLRKNGIRIDENARKLAIKETSEKENIELKAIFDKAQKQFNINSSREVASVLIDDGCVFPKTPTGQWSVTKETMAENEGNSDLCKRIIRARALNKLRTTFLEKSIDEHICPDGRIHCSFHPLRRDAVGTITGRWSCTDPNLQQIPRNDEELGAMARGMFIPEENCWYGHTDYSQVEYRIFAHYACGYHPNDELQKKANAMRERFIAEPDTDYHQFVIDTVSKLTGVTMSRPMAKRVNFGVLYFMGVNALSRKFNIPYDEAQEVYSALFEALPFIESTRQLVVSTGKNRGYIKTILGRRQRVSDEYAKIGKYYPLFNYLIQGSAADVMKKGLIDCYEAGVYDVLKLHLLVHDETGVSIPKTKEGIEAYKEQQHLLSSAVKFNVPILAEADFGKSWGETISENLEDMYKEIV